MWRVSGPYNEAVQWNQLFFQTTLGFSVRNKKSFNRQEDPMNNSFQILSGGREIWPLEWIAWLNWRGLALGPVRKMSKGKRQIPLWKQEPNPPQLYRKMEFWLFPLPYYVFIFYWARGRKGGRVIYWTLQFQISVIQLLANVGVGHNWFLQLLPLTSPQKIRRLKK